MNLRQAIEREARGMHVWAGDDPELRFEHLAVSGKVLTVQTYFHEPTEVSDPEAALWLM